ATAGEKIVRITARKETGKTTEGGMGVKVPETIDLLPAKYNTNSTLKYSVLPAGQNKADFSLE
ncbi:MAG TPA: hypothetical protein VL096_15425, partial [Pirellulaceae bacterium]|nr:hypothetical protein [Pirellulaceae bacterium]